MSGKIVLAGALRLASSGVFAESVVLHLISTLASSSCRKQMQRTTACSARRRSWLNWRRAGGGVGPRIVVANIRKVCHGKRIQRQLERP
jgi:hypothetical protein